MYSLVAGSNGFDKEKRSKWDGKYSDPIAELLNEELVANQHFISRNTSLKYFDDIGRDEFVPNSKYSITEAVNKVKEIHSAIADTNIIYSSNSSPQYLNMQTIIDNMDKIAAIKERLRNEHKTSFDTIIDEYNGNLEDARDELIQIALRRLAKNFNDDNNSRSRDFYDSLIAKSAELNGIASNAYGEKLQSMYINGASDEEIENFRNEYYICPRNSKYYDKWDEYQVALYADPYIYEKTACGGYFHQFPDGDYVVMESLALATEIQFDNNFFIKRHRGKHDPSADEIIQRINEIKKRHNNSNVNAYIDDKMRLNDIYNIASAMNTEMEAIVSE